MNKNTPLLATVVLSVLLTASCGQNEPPPPMPVEQVPATVENAFKEANPELKGSAGEIVTAIQGKDEPKALLDLQALFARPDLTPEQREAANRSMISLNQKLRTAAEQGDQRAAEALQVYRARN